MTEPDNDPRLKPLLGAYAAQERRRRGEEAPDLEEVLAFVEGRLEGDDYERVADEIAAFPEAADLARALAAFAADADEHETAADNARAASWPKLRDRLEAAGWPGAGKMARPSAPAAIEHPSSPAPSPRTSPPATTLWWAAAAAVVAAVVGFAAGGGFVGESPQANPVVAMLRPAGDSGARTGEAAVTRVGARPSERLVLILAYAGGGEETLYRLDLVDAADSRLWSTDRLRRGEAGEFTVGMPSGYLDPGSYRLELRAAHATGGDAPLETWTFRVDPE